VTRLVKYVLLEVFFYGPAITEPPSRRSAGAKDRPDLMQPMLDQNSRSRSRRNGPGRLRQVGGRREVGPVAAPTPALLCRAPPAGYWGAGEPICLPGLHVPAGRTYPHAHRASPAVLAAKAFPSGGPVLHQLPCQGRHRPRAPATQPDPPRVGDYDERGPCHRLWLRLFCTRLPLPVWAAALDHAGKNWRRSEVTARSRSEDSKLRYARGEQHHDDAEHPSPQVPFSHGWRYGPCSRGTSVRTYPDALDSSVRTAAGTRLPSMKSGDSRRRLISRRGRFR